MKSLLLSFFKQHKLVYLWLILCLLMLLYLYGSLRVQSDISFFLPQDNSEIDSVMQQQLQKGEAGKIFLIALQTPADSRQETTATQTLAKLNKILAARLQQSQQFSLVENGQVQVSSLIIEPFYRYRYLLNDNQQQSFSNDHLANSFIQLLQRIEFMLSPMEQKLFAEDPQMIWPSLLKQWQTQQLPKHHGVWFDQQARQTLLFVKSKADAYDLEQQYQNLEIINSNIKQIMLEQQLTNAIDYLVTGAPVFALESKKAISKQIQIISVLASCTLMLFLYWFFRSLKIMLIIAVPLAFAILTGMTAVILLDGFIHGISIAFGITIIGVAVDYPVHFFSHYLFLPSQSTHNRSTTIMQSIWPMMRLGLITTIIGFSAITLSDFSGLRQLGIFAISGLLAAALFTRWVLPRFKIVLPEHHNTLDNHSAYAFIQKIVQRPAAPSLRLIAIILPVLALVYILFNQTHLWQEDLSALSPVPQWQKQQDFQLRKAMGLPELRYALILQGQSTEALLQRSEQIKSQLEKLKQQGIISGYDMAARYLPSIKQQQTRQQGLPSSSELKQRLETLLDNSPLQPSAFSPFIDAVNNSRQMTPLSSEGILSDAQSGQSFIHGKIKTLLYLQQSEYRPEHQQAPEQQSLAVWTAIIPLHGVQHGITDHEIIHSISNQASLLDLKTQTQAMLADYRNEALLWFFCGSMLILLVLFAASRRLISLLPLAWPFIGAVLLTIASLLLMGYSLSIFHLVTLLLVAGLGIDYSIFSFFPRQQGNEVTQLPEVARVSVIICLISTLIMFGALALSELPVLKAIGITASLGALYAFLLTLFVTKQA